MRSNKEADISEVYSFREGFHDCCSALLLTPCDAFPKFVLPILHVQTEPYVVSNDKEVIVFEGWTIYQKHLTIQWNSPDVDITMVNFTL